MNSYLKKYYTILGFIISYACLCGTSAFAQGNDGEGDIIELSPFVVEASSMLGYDAPTTLAGSGLKTKLTDIAASVSVITPQFFEDTGSTDLRDVLLYQTNMEATGFGGNFSGANPNLGGETSEPALSNNVGTRVRGLSSATNARNFFRSIIPLDSYNVERVDINRGANALLFGLGSPAGIINSTTHKAALHGSFGKLALSYGSHGSYRSMIDYNKVISEDELALRVSAVLDDEKFQQNPAFSRDERLFLAGTWRIKGAENKGIFDSTTIRVNYEDGSIEANNPRLLTPTDRLSSWFSDSLPSELQALGAQPKVGFDPRQHVGGRFSAARGTSTIGVISNVNRAPVFMFQNPTDTAPRDAIQNAPGGEVVLGRPYVSDFFFFDNVRDTPLPENNTRAIGTHAHAFSRATARISREFGLPDASFFTSRQMSDPSVFNFFDNLIDGSNKEELSNFDSFEAVFEQLMLENKLGVEVAFNKQNWDTSRQSLIPLSVPYIAIDVNTHLWTGEVNPNFGRPFIATPGQADYAESSVDAIRAKAFYKLNFEDNGVDGKLGRILGEHIFSVIGQKETFESENRGGGFTHFTSDNWLNGRNQNRRGNSGKIIGAWTYLGPSLTNTQSLSGINLPGLQASNLNFQESVNGQGVVVGYDRAAASADSENTTPFFTPITIQREDRVVSNTAGWAIKNERELDSFAGTLQSYWLEDLLVTTVGWRKEDVSTYRVSAPIDPGGEGFRLVNDPSYAINKSELEPQNFSQTLFAWSGVLKMPNSWTDKVSFLDRFNVYMGESENFNPPSSQAINSFGEEIAPPAGETKEYGFSFNTLDDKLTVRLNFFETSQKGDFNGAVGGLAGTIVGLHQSAFRAVAEGFATDGGGGFPVDYVAPPQDLLNLFDVQIANGNISSTNPGVTDTSDVVTEGKELELLYRPTNGLSFMFNVSKAESTRDNTGAVTRKLIFETPTASGKSISEEWLSDWALNIPLNAAGLGQEGNLAEQNIFAGNFLLRVINRFNVNALADGRPVNELRKWRWNFLGNYQFQEGRMKGFGAGVGVRWIDEAAIGLRISTFEEDLSPSDGVDEPGDIRVQDPGSPIFGSAETRHDGWISYQRPILDEKYDMKIQLNVRNMFTEDELIPVIANPDGSIAAWSIAEGRRYTLSTTFSF